MEGASDWVDLDYFLIGTNALVGGIVYFFSKSDQQVIQNLKDAPVVDVGPELDKLIDNTKPDHVIPYIAIRGAVQLTKGSEPLTSSAGVKGVLKAITVNEHSIKRHSTGFWGDSVREIVNTITEVPFGLKSLNDSSKTIVQVVNPSYATQHNLLVPVDTKFDHVNSGIASTVLGYFAGNAATGIETTEKLLPLGTNITAIGKLVKNVNGSNPHVRIMNHPDKDNFAYILSTYSVNHIIEKMESHRNTLQFISWIFFGIGFALTMRKGWKLYKLYEERQMRQRILRERRERETARRANNPPQLDENGVEIPNPNENEIENIDRNGNQDNTQLCIVCLVNPREVILLPCGHVAVCVNCLDRLNRLCPVCRHSITSTHVAYIA